MMPTCDFCEEILLPDCWAYPAGVFSGHLSKAFCDDYCARLWAVENFMFAVAEEHK